MSFSKEHVFQCDCHDYHFLMFEWWPEDKKAAQIMVNAFVSIGGRDWDSLRKRVQAAWRMLRGKEYSYYEVVLNPEDAARLRDALQEYVNFVHVQKGSWLDELADVSEDLPGVRVCVTHMRFIPCRRDGGHVISEEPADIERVRVFQNGIT
jgi:hypothetical protein